jgi:hypothetical protein
MRRKFGSELNPVGVRPLAILIICTVASFIAVESLLAFLHPEPSPSISQRTLTFAQTVAHQQAIQALPASPTSPSTVVLYDQYNNVGVSSTLSATFTDFPTTNSDLADDFVVPGEQTWTVQSIDADGVYFNGAGPATDWNVFFYIDNAGFPGTQIYSATHQPVTQSGTTFSVNLAVPAVLNAGTYWVEIQANMTYSTQGEWGWINRTITSNNPAAWQNPNGGLGVCPSWARRGTDCGSDPSEPDQVYRLNGTFVGPTPTPVPTGCYANYTTVGGCDALSLLTTGAGNTALGWSSLSSDTTGSFNTGVGGGALPVNNADSNTAVGAAALLLNTTGTQNTAVGTDTLVFNDSGSTNTATGYFALMNNTTGNSNTAIGWEALTANTTGDNNTAVGNQALQNNVTTSDNVAIGSMAGSGITTVDNNIMIGHNSGVHSVFGQVSDRCTIDNISGAPVSAATAIVVMVDSDGRLGTVSMDGPDPGGFSPEGGVRPQAIPDAAKRAAFNLKVQKLRATVTQQQQQIESLTAQLKEHAAQIQKVNAQLQVSKAAPKTIVNKP